MTTLQIKQILSPKAQHKLVGYQATSGKVYCTECAKANGVATKAVERYYSDDQTDWSITCEGKGCEETILQ